MKKQFDNNNISDGKTRIAMPTGKRGGGKFSFSKCLIFIVILALVIFYSVLVSRNFKTEKNNRTAMDRYASGIIWHRKC